MFILGDSASGQFCAEHQHPWGSAPWGREPRDASFLSGLSVALWHVVNYQCHEALAKKGVFSMLHLHSQVIPGGRQQEPPGAATSALPVQGSSGASSCVLDVSGFPLAAPDVCRHRSGAVLSPAHASGAFRASTAAPPFPPAQTQLPARDTPPAPPQGMRTRSFPRPFPGSPPALMVTDASKHDATSLEPCTFRP